MAYTYSFLPWEECADLGFGTAETMGIGICVTSNNILVALTKNGASYWGVCRSDDDGQTWEDHFTSSVPTYMSSIKHFGGGLVIATGMGSSGAYYFKSTDHGVNWTSGYFDVGVIGNGYDLIKASDDKYYLAANKVVYYSENLVDWTATTGWASCDWRQFKAGLCQAGSGGTIWAAGRVDLGATTEYRIWKATSPYTSWSVDESDFGVELYSLCYHNGDMYAAGYTGSSPYEPAIFKLVTGTWTQLDSFPSTAISEPVIALYSVNDEKLIAITGTTANFAGYGSWISYDDGVTWYVNSLNFIQENYDPNSPPQHPLVDYNGKIWVATTYNGEAQIWKAPYNTFLTPPTPTGIDVTPIDGGKIISVTEPPQEWFNDDLTNWTITKADGGESATLTSRSYYKNKELELDLPDYTDTEVILTNTLSIPSSSNWEIEIDITQYIPDDTSNGFIYAFGVRSSDFNNYFRLRCRQGSTGFSTLARYRINGGSETNLSDYTEPYWQSVPTKLKITKNYDHIHGYAFYEKNDSHYQWVSIGGINFSSWSGQLTKIYLGAWDNSTRGGTVYFDNIRYKHLHSIYYDTSPGVTTGTGTKLEKKLLPYLHIEDGTHYYITTSENDWDESTASSEDSATAGTGFSKSEIVTFNSADSCGTRIIKISEGFLAVCCLNAGDDTLKCSVYSYNGITTPSLIHSITVASNMEDTSSTRPSMCYVDTNKWVICCRDTTANTLQVYLLSFNGSDTITNHGQKLTSPPSTVSWFTCHYYENNKFTIIYSEDSVDDLEGYIGVVSGTGITFTGPQDLLTTGQEYHMDHGNVNMTQLFVAWYEDNIHRGMKVDISGTTLTQGGYIDSEYNQQYMDAHPFSFVCSPIMNRAIVVYDYYDPYRRDQRVGRIQTVDDFDQAFPEWGVPYEYRNEATQNNVVIPIDAKHILIAFGNRVTIQGEMILYEVDWVNDTFSPIAAGVFENGDVANYGDRGLDIEKLEDNLFALAYSDTDDSSYGKLRIVQYTLSVFTPPAPSNPAASNGQTQIEIDCDENFENEYFTSLDNWSFSKYLGSETATIVSDKMRLDITDEATSGITATYDQHTLPTGDCSIEIDISNYTPDDPDGPSIRLRMSDGLETEVDVAEIFFRTRVSSPVNIVRSRMLLNGAGTYSDSIYQSNQPTKLKVERVDNTFYTYFYENGVWYPNFYKDFGSRASNITKVRVAFLNNADNGGSIDVDNLILKGGTDKYNIYYSDSPGVTVGTGTKIADVSLPYLHTPPSPGISYYYILTAENDFGEGTASSEVNAKTAPAAPTGFDVTPDFNANDIVWNASTGATQYNLYWAIDYFRNEYFAVDLSHWDIYRLTGDEDVYITGGELYTRLYTSTSTGWDIVKDDAIPAGDFTLEADITQYVPSNNSNGHYIYLYTKDSYGGAVDYAFIRYHLSTSGTVHNIRAELSIDGTPSQVNTTVAAMPSKFRIKRVSTTLYIYCYVSSSWQLIHSADFGAYAANIDLVQMSGRPNSTLGGIAKFDNVVYWPDLAENGTKIADVTSPYEHSPLTAGEEYFYVIVAENEAGEGLASLQETGIPMNPTPDPPTGISVVGGEGENVITFTANPEADSTNIYWDTSPGVTKETGNKIADVTSPYTHDDLDPSYTYYYVLVSENPYGEGDESSEYSDSPYPDIPDNVGCVAGEGKNTISWDAVTGADQYNLYYSESSPVTKISGTKVADVTSPYEHSPLFPGIPVYYVVTAEDEDGESDISTEVWGEPVLPSPENPSAELTGDMKITITWDSVWGATKYNIYWLKTPGVTKGTGNKIDNVTSPYIHNGTLDEGDTYYYVITAENAEEESDESDPEVSATAYARPDPPEGVAAVATDVQEITLTWNEVPLADAYHIYWSLFTGVDKFSGTKITDVTSPYIFNAPTADIPYYFVVTAEDTITGESDESLEVNALALPPIPDAPDNVVATPGETIIGITFDPSDYADTYNIYWSKSSPVTKGTGTKISDISSPYNFIVPDLYDTYYFVVTAENETGESVESTQVDSIPDPVVPDPPTNVEGTPTDSNELTISWDAATYAETYNLYYARLPNVSKATATKITGIADLEKVISGLIAGRYYYFAVSSVNPEGESDLSEEAYAKTYVSLSGESVDYIDAKAEQNGVIVTWSDLEGAETYNLYWSKTSPVTIGVANKIENVTSPYRHYRCSTDDPFYIVTGENPLGESDPSEEASADPNFITFQSINFLPENLRDYELFQEFCNILDYVIEKYHYENVDKLTGLYDAVHNNFDPEYILDTLGADYFLEFDLTTDQKKALCLLLSNLYDMKGTKKGLDYVLRLMGLDATVYEWYNINEGMYPEIPETVDPCSIVIDLGLGDHPLLETQADKFANLANYLLWVCVKLHGIYWSKRFEDWFEGIEDQLHTIDIDPYVYDKYCAWRYNYPDVVIIGGAIGEYGDTEGVCDPHYIGEPGLFIGGGKLSDLTWVIEED